MKPTFDRVLVKRYQAETQSPGGITLLEGVGEKDVIHAEVLEVGPGRYMEIGGCAELIPVCVKPGDKVLVAARRGTPVSIGEHSPLIIFETDILAIL